MTRRTTPRAIVIGLGALALGVSVVAVAQARVERTCGHRQSAVMFVLGKLGVGERSHDAVEAAAARWRTRRTAEDFMLIAAHLPREQANTSAKAVLRAADSLIADVISQEKLARSRQHWAYALPEGHTGWLTIGDTDDAVLQFWVVRVDHDRCLAAGTPVFAEQGEVPVESLRAGDRVWGYDLAGRERVLVRVKAIREAFAEETVILGGTLRVSPAHPVYASGTWKPAGEVRAGEVLLGADGKERRAELPARSVGRVRVFDVEVEAPHNLFAGGFLVHNKSR